MKAGASFSRGTTLIFAFSGRAALIGERAAWRILLADSSVVRKFSNRNIALIADKDSAINSGILEALSQHGMEPACQFVLAPDRNAVTDWEDAIDHAIASLRGSDVEKIIVSINLNHWSELDKLFSRLRVLPLPVNLIPMGPASELFKLPSRTIGDTITIELQRGPLTLLERGIKRTFDIIIATTMLILLVPFMLMMAIAIKSDSRGPIIFRQRRCGFNGRKFNIFKYRTMSVMEDGETIAQARPDDLRITRIGRWLRRASIDELPQLFNVLRGEMSLVGPRPHALAHDIHFDKLLIDYAFRQHVKPGITGWAQVHGHRGKTETVDDMHQRIKLDLWYIDNWSFALDFKILVMTMIQIIHGQNAY